MSEQEALAKLATPSPVPLRLAPRQSFGLAVPTVTRGLVTLSGAPPTYDGSRVAWVAVYTYAPPRVMCPLRADAASTPAPSGYLPHAVYLVDADTGQVSAWIEPPVLCGGPPQG